MADRVGMLDRVVLLSPICWKHGMGVEGARGMGATTT